MINRGLLSILVTEEDDTVHPLIAEILLVSGYAVHVAACGEAARREEAVK